MNHLFKADWPLIEQIKMSKYHDNKGNIGGLLHIAKSNFPYLNHLVIGTISSIQELQGVTITI